jgi:methyltransferase (TIGR00027 family)
MCARRTIGVDLTGPWPEPLIAAGLDPHRPTVWLLECFLFYLANDRVTHILDAVTSLAAPGSWLGFDIINRVTLTSPLTRQWIEMQAKAAAPWIGSLDDPAGFLAARGWQATATPIGAPEANYGRWPYPVIPNTMPKLPHHWFVTALKDAVVAATLEQTTPAMIESGHGHASA